MDVVFHASLAAFGQAILSPMGIVAASLFGIGVLGCVLLRNMGDNPKAVVLCLSLCGLLGFAYSYVQHSQPAESLANPVPLHLAPQAKAPLPANAITLTTRGDEAFARRESGYIYVGRYRNEQWQQALFEGPQGVLRTGDVLQLKAPRNMFACAPYRKAMFDLTFTYCKEVIGELSARAAVRVGRPPIVVGLNNVWVYVTEVDD